MRKIHHLLLFAAIILHFPVVVVAVSTDSLAVSRVGANAGTLVGFKFTTLNIEWLACPENGPTNEELQMNNAAKVILATNADVVALQEIGTSNTFVTINELAKKLGTDWMGSMVPNNLDLCGQNQGIVFKKSKVQLLSSQLVNNAGTSYNWASRFPALYNIALLVGGKQVPIWLFNIHAKAMSDIESYNRRLAASTSLKSLLDGSTFNNRNVIVIGDFNDYLIQSQTGSNFDSPYKNFVTDALNYNGPTMHLTDPYYSNKSVIDHIVISNELFSAYVNASAVREVAATNAVVDYRFTTSDHTPISIQLRFDPAQITSTQLPRFEPAINITYHRASKQLQFDSPTQFDQVSLINLQGLVLQTAKDVSNYSFDTNNSGVFLLRVVTGNHAIVRKVVIQ